MICTIYVIAVLSLAGLPGQAVIDNCEYEVHGYVEKNNESIKFTGFLTRIGDIYATDVEGHVHKFPALTASNE